MNEKLTVWQRVGLVLGFLGIIFISINFDESAEDLSIRGVTFILAGAVGVALGNVTLRWLAGRGDVWMLMGLQLIIGSIPLFILYDLFESSQSISWNTSFIITLMILSIFGTAVLAVLWFSLLGRVELRRINMFTFLTPIFALIMGNLYFNETQESIDIIGIALCISSIYLVSFPFSNKLESVSICTHKYC